MVADLTSSEPQLPSRLGLSEVEPLSFLVGAALKKNGTSTSLCATGIGEA